MVTLFYFLQFLLVLKLLASKSHFKLSIARVGLHEIRLSTVVTVKHRFRKHLNFVPQFQGSPSKLIHKIRELNISSLEFHVSSGDWKENWIDDSIFKRKYSSYLFTSPQSDSQFNLSNWYQLQQFLTSHFSLPFQDQRMESHPFYLPFNIQSDFSKLPLIKQKLRLNQKQQLKDMIQLFPPSSSLCLPTLKKFLYFIRKFNQFPPLSNHNLHQNKNNHHSQNSSFSSSSLKKKKNNKNNNTNDHKSNNNNNMDIEIILPYLSNESNDDDQLSLSSPPSSSLFFLPSNSSLPLQKKTYRFSSSSPSSSSSSTFSSSFSSLLSSSLWSLYQEGWSTAQYNSLSLSLSLSSKEKEKDEDNEDNEDDGKEEGGEEEREEEDEKEGGEEGGEEVDYDFDFLSLAVSFDMVISSPLSHLLSISSPPPSSSSSSSSTSSPSFSPSPTIDSLINLSTSLLFPSSLSPSTPSSSSSSSSTPLSHHHPLHLSLPNLPLPSSSLVSLPSFLHSLSSLIEIQKPTIEMYLSSNSSSSSSSSTTTTSSSSSSSSFSLFPPPLIHRVVSDSRLNDIYYTLTITNPSPSHYLSLYFIEPLPIFFSIYYHTFKYNITTTTTPSSSSSSSSSLISSGFVSDLPSFLLSHPTPPNHSPPPSSSSSNLYCTPSSLPLFSTLSFSFSPSSTSSFLPPLSTLSLSFTAMKNLPSSFCLPFDSARGVYFPGGVVQWRYEKESEEAEEEEEEGKDDGKEREQMKSERGEGDTKNMTDVDEKEEREFEEEEETEDDDNDGDDNDNIDDVYSGVYISSSTLILIPQPDQSMPFNVLTITATIASFLLGSLANVYARRR